MIGLLWLAAGRPQAIDTTSLPEFNEPRKSLISAGLGSEHERSEAGQIAAQLADIPDVRTDRVAAIRQALADGTYETEERLNAAVDALLDEIG